MPNVQLNVVVVGGGIAGLTAALALRRQRHIVTVVEPSSWLREFGAAVTITPNSSRVLTELGIDLKRDVKAAVFRSAKEYRCTSKDQSFRFGSNGDGRELPWVDRLKAINLLGKFYMAHRVDLHEALKNKCISQDGPGEPVRIVLSSKVVSWHPEGSVKLSDGTEIFGDLIVAADGIRSEAHAIILGHKSPATPSGLDNLRFIVKTEDILNDPTTAPLMDDGPGCFAFYVDPVRKRNLLRYACRNDGMQNFGAYAPTDNADNLIGRQASLAEVSERLSTLPPMFQAIGTKASSIYLWKIGDRKPIPSYTKDKLVLVGDAAHPMWPRQGQGAAQSIEDGGTLGVLMSNLTSKAEVPARLKLYDELRVHRTSIVQLLSRTSEVQDEMMKITRFPDAPLPEEIAVIFRRFGKGSVPANYQEVTGWLWGHDCIKEAQALMASSFLKAQEEMTPLQMHL
ncbi:hypothetical protein H2200_007526 [Cladophialophora chaetospira]|uniref:FAD-binding domain-containing protein n=1 Tax=Cladophialophora chaetospira TaxID=386627 RepID=A0AA38X844_9EURO|nr:hypothetical protein H2200_007526 [Cladophialophora chaetospira]